MSDEKKEVQETKVEEQVEEIKVDTSLDDEKRTGIKEAAVNAGAMAVEKDKPVTEKKDAMPSFFVDKAERRKIDVDILSSKDDGRILSVSWTGLGIDFSAEKVYLRHDVVWFDFTIPSYEDMFSYRQRSAKFHKEAGQLLVDKLQLRNFFLVWHLKDWSLTDKDGNKVELKHDDDGSLDSESLKKVYAIHPTMLDIVLTRYEKDLLLV